ncbi:MAG: flagellar basal body P-ring formation chaperone FlgA [Syntrophales bacterium]|jgi:flagella basal body P-ring formation protein FlgA|nr:flagellar basal body P-ring formation chaperone FlgA [Syntrophales bacterium]MDY0043342.1 flagellar basal body P-ring formation chaperone FlgA [Syntrophales bacterium]
MRWVSAVFMFLASTLLCEVADVQAELNKLTMKGEALEKIVLDYIEEKVPSARVEFLSRTPDLVLKAKEIAYRVDSGRNEDYAGYCVFNVRFYDGEYFIREQPVRVRIEIRKKFVVSKKFLERGKRIGADDVKITAKWIDRTIRNPLQRPEEVIGKVLRSSVRKNTELKENMLQDPLLVKNGAFVRIELSKRGLHMSTVGISEQSGSLGDLIKVKNISSNKSVYARIVDDSVVKVDF